MKKLTKLLALVLAVAMLLPVNALAAENEEPKDMMIQWLSWEDDPQPETEIHVNNDINMTPYDEIHVALYTNEEVPIPVEKLEVSEGLIVRPLCLGEQGKGKEHYVRIVRPAEWNKEYTISYEGCVLTIESRLPELGLYTAPEATVENYIPNQTMGFTVFGGDCSAYIICTATDETRGRHLVDLAFAEDYADKDSFKLEKVSDSVYKVTLTGSTDVDGYILQMTATWKNVSFMGGNTYSEPCEFRCWECASLLVSDSPTMKYVEMDPRANYYDEKDNFTNQLTLKAGESKTVYMGITYFPGDPSYWVAGPAGASILGFGLDSSSALKLTMDDEDPTKLTISCDVPGTYTLQAYDTIYPEVEAVYHEDGTQYTKADFLKFYEDVTYSVWYRAQEVQLIVLTDAENYEWVPFEEAMPGQKVEYHVVKHDPYTPITVTVESDKLPFTDVDEGTWYEPAVRFVSGKGYMNGASSTKFNPEGKITGAEFCQLLYNKAGKPAAADGASFQGVDSQWYAPAVLWAAGEGIITDTGDAAVALEADLTRQQIAVMLYNSLGKPEGTADLSVFSDADQVSAWAKAAMEWAVSAKVFQGSNGKLDPTGTATRAQVAQLLLNYFGK